MTSSPTHHSTAKSLVSLYAPMVVIAALAMTLRPLITSTGPLLDEIRLTTGIGLQAASLLVVLPMFCMGVFPLLLPWVGRRLSESAWITSGLLAIAFGSVWRFWLGSGWALIASAFIGGVGIAIVQAMAPGVVKRWYPLRVPLAMGIYSAALMSGGGGAAILSPLIADYTGHWQTALGVWVLVPIIAGLLWMFRAHEVMEKKYEKVAINFFRNKRAWLLAIYFGLANGGYACMIAWLPTYARSLGWSAQDSGELIGLMTIFQVLGALAIPALSGQRLDRRPWLFVAIGMQILGFAGLMAMSVMSTMPAMSESWLMVWVALIGCGLGAGFSLTLTVALDHIAKPKLAGALTAFVQGIGFIITAIAPYVAGILREWTGNFQAVWLMLMLTMVAMLLVTIKFNPKHYTTAINLRL